MMGRYQSDNVQYFRTKNKNSFNQIRYSDAILNPEDTKVLKKFLLKLRKKLKYSLLTFFNSKK
jgi:hypothetical protein